MTRTTAQLRRDALQIWQAGVDAVRSDRLVRECVRVRDGALEIGGQASSSRLRRNRAQTPFALQCEPSEESAYDVRIDLGAIRRIVVVGAGKAGAGMAAGLEEALGEDILRAKDVTGWINVPENCVRKLGWIHLHAARPAGVNEPTQAGVDGSREIMRLVGSLTQDDLCIALISGGGSALLPLPVEGVTLDDKLAVTRHLSAAGANIEELNTVRKQLSQIKGGGLARACGAGRLITLVISDVLGDPLDLIASGPTVVGDDASRQALEVLERYGACQFGISKNVFYALARGATWPPGPPRCQVINRVIGNNATAVRAAVRKAGALGYVAQGDSATRSEGAAEDVGRNLAVKALLMQSARGPDCLVSGGEPTVKLIAADKRGKGGRNQQLVLAATEIPQIDMNFLPQVTASRGFLILSGGTDGEDGPTDAAGAWVDAGIIDEARLRNLDPADYLARNDAYHWFEPLGALIKTGPTDTNVCDLRVVLVDREDCE